MSDYYECPRCGNSEVGETIWNCGDCGCVHCKNCDPDNGHCPECDSSNMNSVGEIVDEDDEDEEDDGDSEAFSECPRCGKTDSGDTIWKCKDCGCQHCKDCDPDNGHCPECGSGRVTSAGSIS